MHRSLSESQLLDEDRISNDEASPTPRHPVFERETPPALERRELAVPKSVERERACHAKTHTLVASIPRSTLPGAAVSSCLPLSCACSPLQLDKQLPIGTSVLNPATWKPMGEINNAHCWSTRVDSDLFKVRRPLPTPFLFDRSFVWPRPSAGGIIL